MASKSLNELTLAMLAGLLKKGVEVMLIHAKEPGTAWIEDHEKHPHGDLC
jgi:hypothetical protein